MVKRIRLLFLISVLSVSVPSGSIASSVCSATVNSFPYTESFENGAGNWFTGGTASDWALGSPSKSTINIAGDGSDCWVTGGLIGSAYNPGQRSWLQSPCFDFSSLLHPEIRFMIYWETEYQFDGGNLQYSIDNGATWQTLGDATQDACQSENWYNISSITNLSGIASPSSGWSGTTRPTSGSCRGGNGSGGWVTASYCLPQLAGLPSVAFRFTFGSGTTCNDFDGIAIDLFRVGELIPRVTTMSYQCQSSRTILFTDEQPDCRDLRSWDFGDGTIETNAAPDISHTFLQEGTYTITLSAEHSCLGTEITVISVNILSFNAEINPVTCSGTDDGSIIIQPVPGSLANTQINWLTPGLSGFSISGIGPGQYVFQLTANRSCAVSDTILMPDRPNAPQPVIGPDRTICPGSAVLLKTALSYTQYLWSDGSIGSSLLVNDPGNYWLQVTDSDGCSGRDSVYLELECLTEPVFPSAFTPNGDLKNDYFQIYCGSIIIEDWYVMDRWGQRLFHSTDPLQVWEGDDVPEGVYVCLVRYRDTDDNLIEKTGRITLIR